MQIIKMFGNFEHIVKDDEADNVAKMWGDNPDRPIKLRNGTTISPKGIVEIGEPKKIAYYDGYILEKGGRSFIRDGERIFLETEDYAKIEYKEHPRYIKIREEMQKRDNNKQLNIGGQNANTNISIR